MITMIRIHNANYDSDLPGGFVEQIYPKELTLNKADITSSSCQCLELDMSLFQCSFNTRVYHKRGDFYFLFWSHHITFTFLS